jgi:hypothetical protein
MKRCCLDILSGVVFIGLVWAVVSRPPQPDPRAVAFWVTLDARCQSISHRQVYGNAEQRAAADAELKILLAEASRWNNDRH